MKKIKEKYSIQKIEERASKNLKIHEVYLGTELELETIEYLKKQKYIEFSKIEIILKNNFIPIYPFGYILKNKKNDIVGFMGTIFSIRVFGNKEKVFCNIHTWIVDEAYRINSFLLLTTLVKNKFILTAFTPVKTLVGLLEKFGFIKNNINYRIILLTNFLNFLKKKEFKIEKNSLTIEKLLNEKDLIIFKNYIHFPCEKFIIIDSNKPSNYIFIIATKVIKKKIKTLNIFYVSDSLLLKKEWSKISPLISSEFKVVFCVQHYFDEKDCGIPKRIIFTKNYKKNICIRNLNNNFKLDTLYSDLIE